MAARESYAIKVVDHEIEEIKRIAKAAGKSATSVLSEPRYSTGRASCQTV